jgi:hypothetical protein
MSLCVYSLCYDNGWNLSVRSMMNLNELEFISVMKETNKLYAAFFNSIIVTETSVPFH